MSVSFVFLQLFSFSDSNLHKVLAETDHGFYKIYILLTKREGRTGRISARGRPTTDILPVRSRASLVNKRFIIWLKQALKF